MILYATEYLIMLCGIYVIICTAELKLCREGTRSQRFTQILKFGQDELCALVARNCFEKDPSSYRISELDGID